MDRLLCPLIVPAAGDSLRFKHVTSIPKGLVRFHWKENLRTMLEHVVPETWDGPVYVGVKTSDAPLFRERLPSRFELIHVHQTSGQAQTVLAMLENLELLGVSMGQDFLIVNSDNAFEPGTLEKFVGRCRDAHAMLGALTFRPSDGFERYGYVDGHPLFTCGVEKSRISKHALAGAFYFASMRMMLSRYMSLDDVRYLSEGFIIMPRAKLSVEIPKEWLYEWGTAEALEQSVGTIEWETVP